MTDSTYRYDWTCPYYPEKRGYFGGFHDPALVGVDPDGQLTLTALRRPDGTYASASVKTPPFLYGRVSVVARMPAGSGVWPALWLLTATTTGQLGEPEIDLLEVPQRGNPGDTTTGYMTHHWQDPAGTAWQIQNQATIADTTAGLHRYTLDWQPDHITWAIDGTEAWRVTSDPTGNPGRITKYDGHHFTPPATPCARIPIPAVPMQLCITNGIGRAGAWVPAPDTTTKFPAVLTVAELTITPH